ncbi:MAG: gluconokinase, GntK/IdnK-type [Anaerolineae bacterium]|jgi:carbohydrate kinase (thermoresistant glucokinase family)
MIIIMMGVSGSGKTTVGRCLASDLGWGFFEGDDYHPQANVDKMAEGIPLTDKDRQPWLARLCDLIQEMALKGQDAVITSSALKTDYRDFLRSCHDEVRLVYLQGEFSLIHQRLEARRGHFMDADLLASQFDDLEEPEEALIVSIAAEPAAIVRDIKGALGLVPSADRPAMELHRLGTTTLSVSPLGIGLAALGRPGYINLGHAQDLSGDYRVAAMEAQAHAVLDAAYDKGLRYFDVARSYGRAEAFLGSWLKARNLSPGSVVIGSKWGYTYTADWQVDADIHEVKEHSLPVLERQWAESRVDLGAHLDLYQIHSATEDSGVLRNQVVLAELARLKSGAKIAIGLTVSGMRQGPVIEQALEIEVDGVPLFDTVQATWNLLERSAGPALAQAHAAGVGVIVKEALANGRLTPRNQDPEFPNRMALLQDEACRLGTSVDGLALAAVLAQPWADVVLSGAARVDHLLSNVAALDVGWDDNAAGRLKTLQEPTVEYWSRRDTLTWN